MTSQQFNLILKEQQKQLARRTAGDRRALHAPREKRPHAPDDGAGERSLHKARQSEDGQLAGPRAFLRGGFARDAAHPGGPRSQAYRRQARRRHRTIASERGHCFHARQERSNCAAGRRLNASGGYGRACEQGD